MRNERLILPEGRNYHGYDVNPNYSVPNLDKLGAFGSVKVENKLLYTTPELDIKTSRSKGMSPRIYLWAVSGSLRVSIYSRYHGVHCFSAFMKQLSPKERFLMEEDLPEIMDLLNIG